jgi:hypothetical protein
MQVTSAASAYGMNSLSSGVNANALAKADRQFADLFADDDDPLKELADITSGGAQSMWAWELKQIKKKAVQQVMGSMGVTQDSVAAMSPKQRLDMENKILKAVEQKVKEMMREAMEKQHKNNGLLPGLSAGASDSFDMGAGLDISA